MIREVYCDDWLNNDLEDKSIDVIMADSPYFEVKGEFDFIWSSFDDYLKDVEKWAIECKRVLKDNGSLFWWGDAKKIAYAQVIIDKYLNIENNLVWENTNQHKQQIRFSKGLRSFAPITERCLFYSNENINTNNLCVGYIRDYIRGEILKSKGKIVLKKVNTVLGTATNGGGVASAVLSLDKLEPSMITKEHYLKIREWLGVGFLRKEYEELRKEYEELRKEYEELRKEYEELRRPFENIYDLGDVIKYANRETKNYEHDTIKPVTIIKQLLKSTTRKDSTVLIPFGGSGTDVEACIDLGLDYICYEIDPKHYDTIKKREKECLKQPLLFV